MIDFQSSVIAEWPNYRPCHSPSLGGDLNRLGSGERNLAEPKVTWRPSKRARQSALIQLGRARDASLLAGRPLGHSVILSKTLCLCALAHSREESVFIGVYPWLNLLSWHPKYLSLRKAMQGYANPRKHTPREGGGGSNERSECRFAGCSDVLSTRMG
jgi:hypothetical protein